MSTNQQQPYTAGQVEPGWQILIDDQWLVAGVVIESEAPGGAQYITIVFNDSPHPAVKLPKAEAVSARPPQQLPAEPGA